MCGVKALSLDWIAGFIDGEGYITIMLKKAKGKGSAFGYWLHPHIDASQKIEGPLNVIKSRLEMGRVVWAGHGYLWCIDSREDCLKFIELMKGRLILKDRNIQILSDFFSLKQAYQPWTRDTFLKGLELVEDLRKISPKHHPVKFERLRRIREEVLANTWTPEERKRKISQSKKGFEFLDSSRTKMSISAKNRVKHSARDRFGRFC